MAKATAVSFPDFSISPYNKSCTVILSFTFNPNLEPPVPAAFLSIVTTSVKSAFSSTTIAVIILVVLAIGTCFSPFFSYKIVLEALSKTRPILAFNFGSPVIVLEACTISF